MNNLVSRLNNFINSLTTSKVAILFIIIGLLIYINSIFNGFVADDFLNVSKNPSIRMITNVDKFFLTGISNEEIGQANNYYRPIPLTAYSIIYLFFKGNPLGFHLVQVFIHIFNTILVFLIFKLFFKKAVSFFASLIFLIHPINTEAVIYVSALQENLFLFFGLTAFYLAKKRYNDKFHPVILSIVLLISLLSKETAVAFLFLIPVYDFLFERRKLLTHLLVSSLVFGVYCFLRFVVAKVYFNSVTIVPIMTLSLEERVLNIPQIIFFYLKTFFSPKDLVIYQDWTVKSLNLAGFYLPLVVDTVFLALLSIVAVIFYKKNKDIFKTFFFFLIWFLLGLGAHLQIIPLDQTVADRWFYFPVIGLLGLLVVVIQKLASNNWFLKIGSPLFLVIVVLLSVRVVMRNSNWKNEESLYTHDIKINKDSSQLERGLGDVASSNGDFDKAEKHYIRSVKLFPNLLSYNNLGYLYLRTSRLEEAEITYNEGLNQGPSNAAAWAFLAITKYKLGDHEGATYAAKKAYEIAPSKTFYSILDGIQRGIKIDVK